NSILIDGHSLSLNQIIWISLDKSILPNSNLIQFNNDHNQIDSIKLSNQFLLSRTNLSTYGVTTGFGASATTRTASTNQLQVSIIEHLLAGVTSLDFNKTSIQSISPPQNLSLPLNHHIIPESIVRAAILIRINTLARGHSAVRLELLNGLIQLLSNSITPIIPLRGTISASGDLSPLAYIAGTLIGHPDVFVIDRSNEKAKILSSIDCLKAHKIQPIVLGPKEGLAISNGTAFSAAAASIALYQAHVLALLSQVLTAMVTEALVGQIGAFHPFIHQIARPHPGQIEVAETIFKLLHTSQLLDPNSHLIEKSVEEEKSSQILRQDRYPIRTAPQWIGPQLEDLVAAHHTLTRELNSTTDNPLTDVQNGLLHHGGNFQATSVATSMEKTRLAIAAIGKLMFAQMTELNNALMNKGLPSCLNGHEPSTNYHTKGLDTSSAAYCAELQYLASPVTTHVQSAEGHNQSVNSMAFVSARKTLEAIDVLKLLMASHLYCICQALDLRVFENDLRKALLIVLVKPVKVNFGDKLPQSEIEPLVQAIVERFWARRELNSSLDSPDRIHDSLQASLGPIIEVFDKAKKDIPTGRVESFIKSATDVALEAIEKLRFKGLGIHTAEQLGGTRAMYEFVRIKLGVKARRGDVCEGQFGPTVGGMVGKIFNGFTIGNGLEEVLAQILK
ncbi:hypothetical protein O181_085114, partial [Austropuccinia psidii MF-1]|nr:hypothetical protein [Austropuccinia psidii MF-1]